MDLRRSAEAAGAPPSETRSRCVTRWHTIADTEAASALADIIFSAVSSVYVNDSPAVSATDSDQEAAAL